MADSATTSAIVSTPEDFVTIGFIGLGRMGGGMALNLARKYGAELVVHDVVPDATSPCREHGARVAADLGALARECDVVFFSLPGPAQVEETVFGPHGILAHARPGQALFDLSTNSVTLARRVHDALAERGTSMMDAPVSGGPVGAASGTLVSWIGGSREVFDANLPVLESFCRPSYVGDIGIGTITKLAHNMSTYLIVLSLAETFSVAVKAGADPLELWKALRQGGIGQGSPLDLLVNQFLPGVYEPPAFALKLAHKDVSLATALGREVGVPMRLANLTLDEMTEALGRGFGDQDSRSFLKLQLERAGVEVAVDREALQAVLDGRS
ncbi:NAD(P)-dependent oxidoreductase [Streptomyces sp. MI02-2A]|uniref:NAD(P)-dependent oxidoreductase n=1 Tax=Streptomyces sp. MI02-2A TaxID=3028688 RepID=UPI0029C0CA94|nr:NAD(P)-dependent oxidoreductase [Streptomyces sp. MI02-2A]